MPETNVDSEKQDAVKQAQKIVSANCQDAILKMDTSDGGNADAFVAMYGDQFKYVREIGWLHWNGKYWQQDDSAVMLAMRESFSVRYHRLYDCEEDNKAKQMTRSTNRLYAAIEQAKALLAIGIDNFDKSPDEINVDNGVLNLRTGELTPHDPSQLFTYELRAPYDEQADMSTIAGFMEAVLTKEGEETNSTLVEFMQTALGYTLTGHTREEKLFYLYGQLGRNGKGTITEALQELVPEPIAIEQDFQTFIAKRDGDSQNFDLADLKGSRIVFASESNKYQMLNPASIKKLTGGNYVRAAHKYREFFTYRPQYKVWLSSNHKVNGDPDDSVMWHRVLVIEFPNSYMDREDKTLKELLKSPEVQKGLLRWLVIGAMRWYQKGLVIPEEITLATKKHQEDLDTINDWFEDALQETSGGFVLYSAAYQNYETWCKYNGVPVRKARQFQDAMERRGYKAERSYRPELKQTVRGYVGLEIVTAFDRPQGSTYAQEVQLKPQEPSQEPPQETVYSADEEAEFMVRRARLAAAIAQQASDLDDDDGETFYPDEDDF